MMTYVVSYAVMSGDGLYRYVLVRKWDLSKPVLLIVMLNPSTADGSKDDATIRSCVRLAKGQGFGGILVCNLFAWRATHPIKLPQSIPEAIGQENDTWLRLMAIQAHTVVAAWGAFVGTRGLKYERAGAVVELLTRYHPLHVFKLTPKGAPNHPLYLKNGTTLVPWKAKAVGVEPDRSCRVC